MSQSQIPGSQNALEVMKDQLMLKNNSHPLAWWEAPPRKAVLRAVFQVHSDDSENDYGQPVYVPSKDPNYVRDLQIIQARQHDYHKGRDRIIKENAILRQQGKQLKKVPDADAEKYALTA